MGLLDWFMKGGPSEEELKKRAAQEALQRGVKLEGQGAQYLRVDRDGNPVEDDDGFVDLNKKDLGDEWDVPVLMDVKDHRTLGQKIAEDGAHYVGDPDITDEEHAARRIKGEELLKEIEEDQTPPPATFEIADKPADKTSDEALGGKKKTEGRIPKNKHVVPKSKLKSKFKKDGFVDIAPEDLEPLDDEDEEWDEKAEVIERRHKRDASGDELDRANNVAQVAQGEGRGPDHEVGPKADSETGREEGGEEDSERSPEGAQSRNPLNRFRGRAAEFLSSWTKRTPEANADDVSEVAVDAAAGPSRAAQVPFEESLARGGAVDKKTSWLRGGWLESQFRVDKMDDLDATRWHAATTGLKLVTTFVARRYGVQLAYDLMAGGLRNYFSISDRREMEGALEALKQLHEESTNRDTRGNIIDSVLHQESNLGAAELADRLSAVQSKIENSMHLKNAQRRALLEKLERISADHVERDRVAYNQRIDEMLRDVRVYTNARNEEAGKMKEIIVTTMADAKSEAFNTGLALLNLDAVAGVKGVVEGVLGNADVVRSLGFMGMRAYDAAKYQYNQARLKNNEVGFIAALKAGFVATKEKAKTVYDPVVSWRAGRDITVGQAVRFVATAGSVGFSTWLAYNGLYGGDRSSQVGEVVGAEASGSEVTPGPRGEAEVGPDVVPSERAVHRPTIESGSDRTSTQGLGEGTEGAVSRGGSEIAAPANKAPEATEAAAAHEVTTGKTIGEPGPGDNPARDAGEDTREAAIRGTVEVVAEKPVEVAQGISSNSIELGLTKKGDGFSQALARQLEKMPADQFRAIADKYQYKGGQDSPDYDTFVANYTRDLLKAEGLLDRGFSRAAIGEVATVGVPDASSPFGMRVEFVHKDGTLLTDDERSKYFAKAVKRAARAVESAPVEAGDVAGEAVEAGVEMSRAVRDVKDLVEGSVLKIGDRVMTERDGKWYMSDAFVDIDTMSPDGQALFADFLIENSKAQKALDALAAAEQNGDKQGVLEAIRELRAIDATKHDTFSIDIPDNVLDRIESSWADVVSEKAPEVSDHTIELLRANGKTVEMDFLEDGSMSEPGLREFNVSGRDLVEAKGLAAEQLGGKLTPWETKRYFILNKLSKTLDAKGVEDTDRRAKWVLKEIQKMQKKHPRAE